VRIAYCIFLIAGLSALVGCKTPATQSESFPRPGPAAQLQLGHFLPQAPPGWRGLGQAVPLGTAGRFLSWGESYQPEASTAQLGVGRVVVHIYFVENPINYDQYLRDLSRGLAGPFHSPESQDYPFYESPPTSNQDFHTLAVDLGAGRYVEIMAWRGGDGWSMGSKDPGTVISAFLQGMDLRGISTAK
jgi:hypothetical protein